MNLSSDAALQTPELLQEILLHLDIRTLLTAAQLVSRQWHGLITASPALQRALYFKPIASTSDPPTLNPLLFELVPYWLPEPTCFPASRLSRNIKSVCKHRSWPKVPYSYAPPTLLEFDDLPMALKSRRHAFIYPRASWRRMFVRQPPIPTVGRRTPFEMDFNRSNKMEMNEVPGALLIGEFYDLVQDWVREMISRVEVFWGPSAVATHGTVLNGFVGMEKDQRDEALKRKAEFAVLGYRADQSRTRSFRENLAISVAGDVIVYTRRAVSAD